MNRFCNLITILIFLFIFIIGVNTVTAKTFYDNFSSDYLDSSKWIQGEFVREVSQGKLVMILHNSPTEKNIRKTTPFANPSLINSIEFDIMLSAAMLDSGADSESFARVDGRFYNAQNSGTERGDIWAGLYFGDRGNGLEAWWYVSESTDDDGNTWDDKGSGSLNIAGLSYNQSYTVKIDYDGANEFTFTVAGVSDAFTGPVKQGAEYSKHKAIETIVSTDGGTGNGYVYASFDDVQTNGSVYDDFSTSPLDQTRWGKQESAREIENDKVRLISHSTGDRDTTSLNFSEIWPYTEATVTIKSDSQLEPGDRGIARMDGYFYNDTYGPGNYNGYEGNVWGGFYINYYSDGTLYAVCSVDKVLDAADTQWEGLFYQGFHVPIILDRAYRFSIHFTGTKLYFSCQDTVTGREDILSYEITTAVYEPYEEYMSLLSRVYGDAAGGYMAVEFDDVYVDVAEPPAIYNATGDWEVTDSDPWSELECDLPDVDGATNVTITQNGNDFTLVAHTDEGDFSFDGVVYGESYRFGSDVEIEGDREVNYGVFHLSQALSGSGSFTSHFWENGSYQCRNGSNIALASLTDSDGDGISDFTESSGPNSGDANNDTFPDSGQQNVASLKAYNSQEYVVLETPAGTVLSSCQAADNPSPGDAPAKMNFDYGFFSFTISGIAPGGSTTLTMTLPDGVKVDTYQKYGKTPANPNIDEWYEFLYDAITDTGVEINNNVLTFHFVDALRGDDVLVQDSMVIDIGGPGFTADDNGGGGGGGSGGCLISTMNK